MNNTLISPGELTVGQKVTVYRWIADPEPAADEGWVESSPFLGMMGMGRRSEPSTYQGDLLEVVGVQLPYVLVLHHSESSPRGVPVTLDIRKVDLMELSPAFVRAKMRQLKAVSHIPSDSHMEAALRSMGERVGGFVVRPMRRRGGKG